MSLDDVDWNEILNKFMVKLDELVQYGIANIPNIEKLVIDVIEATFAPKQIARQIAMISFLQLTLTCYSSLSSAWTAVTVNMTERGRKEKKLMAKLKDTRTYTEWQAVALELDEMRGFNNWRHEKHSTLYDYKVLEKRIRFTRETIKRGDVFDLIFRMRSGLARDQFGMQHEGLFSRALAGTKHIVEKYLDTMCEGLNFICDTPIAEEEVLFC
jgi:TAG lipase / steryl ester hydrolase / phospholipase A2 / LPA acyltransferase